MTLFTCHTNGRGLWSTEARAVAITNLELIDYSSEDEDGIEKFGELRAYFLPKNWNVGRDGLIYTDRQFEVDFVVSLVRLGFPALLDVGYSEQGMQGRNYVSFDAGPIFINAWLEQGRTFS